MNRVKILDCTLRDGGYINDWKFGADAIAFIMNRLSNTGIEYIELGFIKEVMYNPDIAVFPDVESFRPLLKKRNKEVKYFGMIDVGSSYPLEHIPVKTEEDIDGIRVIFKQDKINKGYEYCKKLIELGYDVSAQLVSTNTYTDKELIETINLFNQLDLFALSIVDSLGVIKRIDFCRMIYLIDNNLRRDIAIAYHSHNNLQQARGNAECLVEMPINREIIIDACVYGMGRGAGNLNMELFADYLNENYGKNYRIEPMLEIMDQYLNEIYRSTPWGYSLPYYLSAKNKCHPNYAKYYHEKGTLTEKAFNELLKTISEEDQTIYSKEIAERYYSEYMKCYVDDRDAICTLSKEIDDKIALIIGPGQTAKGDVSGLINSINKRHVTISIGFIPDNIPIDYVFCSNLRRYRRIEGTDNQIIYTSNVSTDVKDALVFNYASYVSDTSIVSDNSALMLIRILIASGVKEVLLMGLDGYDSGSKYKTNYDEVNMMMSKKLSTMSSFINIKFLTSSKYTM